MEWLSGSCRRAEAGLSQATCSLLMSNEDEKVDAMFLSLWPKMLKVWRA